MIPAIARQLGLPYSNREGWLSGLLDRLVLEQDRGKIELGIAFPVDTEMGDFFRIMQFGETMTCHCYGFVENMSTPEIYDASLEGRFRTIFDAFEPDIVHIFGTEFPHALAAAKTFGKPERTLIGLQGICSAIAGVYMADLPMRIQRKATLRDMIRHDSLRQQKKKFILRGKHEAIAMQYALHVAGRTDFDRTEAAKLNPKARYHYLNETMRTSFYKDRWDIRKCHAYRLFVSQGDYPLKGLHYLLRALPKVLEQYPETEVYVAGNDIVTTETLMDRLKLSAYAKYLRKLIHDNKLQNKVHMLGKLNAEEMKEQYMLSHLFIMPSVLENSPNSLGEAMLLGVPSIAADVGGVHNLLEDGGDGFLFPSGDVEALADRIIEAFQKPAIVDRLSGNARKHARVNHDADQNYYRLLRIYQDMMSK